MEIVRFILTLVTLGFLAYVSWRDYFFGFFPLKKVFCFYPVAFLINYSIYGDIMITLFSFLILFLVLYLVEVCSKDKVIGGLDVTIAPLFTCWFGLYSTVVSYIFILLILVARNKKIKKLMMKGNENAVGNPLVPLMMLSLLIGVFVFPSTITEIISSLTR